MTAEAAVPAQPAASAAPRLGLPILAPLAVRAYALFWLAILLIWAADNLRSIASASLTLDLTQRPSGLANLQTVGGMANLLVILFAGLAADRSRPHLVVLAAVLIQTVNTAWLSAAGLVGELAYWHLIVFSVVGGVAGGLLNGSLMAVVPDLLQAERVRGANALSSITENLSRFIVPPLAGLAVAAVGAPPALALAAGIGTAAAVLLGLIGAPARSGATAPIPAGAAPRAATPFARLREGLRAARQDDAVWTLIWGGAIVVGASFVAVLVGLPSIAKLTYAAGDAGIGLLSGALGAGALLGALAAGSVRSVRRPGIAIVVALVVEGAMLVGVGLAPTLWLAAAGLVFVGLAQASRIVLAVTAIQSGSPADSRGLVIAVATFLIVAPQIPAIALAGYLADALGPSSLFVIGGVLVMLGGAIIFSRRSIRALAA